MRGATDLCEFSLPHTLWKGTTFSADTTSSCKGKLFVRDPRRVRLRVFFEYTRNVSLKSVVRSYFAHGRYLTIQPFQRPSPCARFLQLTGESDPSRRDWGTVGACCSAAERGASIVRVHNVRGVAQGLAVSDAIRLTLLPLIVTAVRRKQ